MTFTKTSHKFGQWADSRANTVYGLGFSSESHLTKVRRPDSNRQAWMLLFFAICSHWFFFVLFFFKFADKFSEFKEAARLAKEKSQEKITSTPSQVSSIFQQMSLYRSETEKSLEDWKVISVWSTLQEEKKYDKNMVLLSDLMLFSESVLILC